MRLKWLIYVPLAYATVAIIGGVGWSILVVG
jgi:hypothetical protein